MAKKKKPKAEVEIKRAEEPKVTQWLSTGCTLLDLAITGKLPGGIPCGRSTHIYGWESSAKSVLAQEPLGSAQRQGGLIWFLDTEQTLDFERAKDLFGIDTDSDTFHYDAPISIEDLFDGHVANAIKEIQDKKSKGPNALALDSLSALPTQVELENKLEDGTYGTSRAKQISTSYRKYLRKINDNNLALIMINQARVNINAMWGDKMTVSGGKALDFYASVAVAMSNVGRIKNEKKVTIGNEFKFKVTKNKVAPPYRTGTFSLLYDYGICDIRTSLNWLREIRGEKGMYSFGNLEFKALADMVKAIEDGNLETDLQQEVEKAWQEMYQVEPRKPKTRS